MKQFLLSLLLLSCLGFPVLGQQKSPLPLIDRRDLTLNPSFHSVTSPLLIEDSQDPLTKKVSAATFAVYTQAPPYLDLKTKETVTPDFEFKCTAFIYTKMDEGYKLVTAGHCGSWSSRVKYAIAEDLDKDKMPVTLGKWVDD